MHERVKRVQTRQGYFVLSLVAFLVVCVSFSNRRDREEVFQGDPSVYDLPEVSAAPPGNQSDGFRFQDARGSYQRLAFGASGGPDGGPDGEPPLYVNVLHTRAGHFRSGDIHKCEQLNHILFGSVLVTRVLIPPGTARSARREVVTAHRGGDVVRIAPHVPHLYQYLEETLMTETWRTPEGRPCAFAAWLYQPLRARIPSESLAAQGGR